MKANNAQHAARRTQNTMPVILEVDDIPADGPMPVSKVEPIFAEKPAPETAIAKPAAIPSAVHKHYCTGHTSMWTCANPQCEAPTQYDMLCSACLAAGEQGQEPTEVVKTPTVNAGSTHSHECYGHVGAWECTGRKCKSQRAMLCETCRANHLIGWQAPDIESYSQRITVKSMRARVEETRASQEAARVAAALAHAQKVYAEAMTAALGEGWEKQPWAHAMPKNSVVTRTPTTRTPRQPAENAVIVQGYSLTVAVYRTAKNPLWCPQVQFRSATQSYKKTVGELAVERETAVAIAQASIDEMVQRDSILDAGRRGGNNGSNMPSLRTLARAANN